ncbi:virulence-associated protein E [Bartonella taylorii]|uniref:Virulence-associated protein E n=1 Tax=Bartonella taylorii TaxID=33046 RepID=A0A9Q8Z037_BARTA|nr:virulence-associated protein E [Bartonella taylorii]USP03315.1 virulence-associated protein E [Bartonella taylorii]
MNAQSITNALHGVWYEHYGLPHCPTHNDRLPSLSPANRNDERLLVYCYAGCSFRKIIQTLIRIGYLGKQAYSHMFSFSKQFCSEDKKQNRKLIKQRDFKAKPTY